MDGGAPKDDERDWAESFRPVDIYFCMHVQDGWANLPSTITGHLANTLWTYCEPRSQLKLNWDSDTKSGSNHDLDIYVMSTVWLLDIFQSRSRIVLWRTETSRFWDRLVMTKTRPVILLYRVPTLRRSSLQYSAPITNLTEAMYGIKPPTFCSFLHPPCSTTICERSRTCVDGYTNESPPSSLPWAIYWPRLRSVPEHPYRNKRVSRFCRHYQIRSDEEPW